MVQIFLDGEWEYVFSYRMFQGFPLVTAYFEYALKGEDALKELQEKFPYCEFRLV